MQLYKRLSCQSNLRRHLTPLPVRTFCLKFQPTLAATTVVKTATELPANFTAAFPYTSQAPALTTRERTSYKSTRLLGNQPPRTPHAPPPPSPTARVKTNVFPRQPPTPPFFSGLPHKSLIMTAVAATAKSPKDADTILSAVAATAVATTRIVAPTTPAFVSRTAKSGGSQPLHFAIRETTCDEYHSQPPGHRVPLGWLSGVFSDACIVPAILSHSSSTASSLVRSTQKWACFRVLVFSFRYLRKRADRTPGAITRQ